MAYLTLLTSLAIASVAAWYSIVGLMAIFAGAVIPIAIMGGVLEVGKLVTAAWLHTHWKDTKLWMRTYLTLSVFLLMIITSLGIFGFLSKAHLEHSISTGGTNELQITNLERRIANEQRSIKDAETVLGQLDETVQTLIDYDRIRGEEGALATRRGQAEERASLNQTIDDAYTNIEALQAELLPLQKEQLAIEVEVGPLKYIAELIYGDQAKDYFDEAVRGVIILLIITFDPLAVVLLLASTKGFTDRRRSKIFYDDGNMRVDPNNVVDVEEILPFDEFEEDPLPDDADDYDVIEEDPDWDHPEDPTETIEPLRSGKKRRVRKR